MPASQDPNFGLNYGWALGEDGWNTGMDANLKKLGALLHLSVLDKDLGTPPGSPAEGDRYIVPSDATGAWSGQTNKIAVRIDGTWEFYTPSEGWNAWVADEDTQYTFNGLTWTTLVASQPYDIHATFNGRPDSGITLVRVIVPRTTTFPAGLTGSYAKSEIAATAASSFPLTKNGASIGSVDWGVGATSATFTFASQQVFAAGDILELTAPAVVDVTLADLGFTLVGWR
jgi:hypothetical protein